MDHASRLTCLSLSSIFSSDEANPNVFFLSMSCCCCSSGRNLQLRLLQQVSVVSAIPHTSFAPSTPQIQQHSHCFISLFTFPHGALGGITLAVTQSFLNNLELASGLQYHHTDNSPQASTATPGQRQGMTL